jgi:hypothetical protein
MCERSPLGLSHAQNRMSGRPQVAEILLMRSPQTPPTRCVKFLTKVKKVPGLLEQLANFPSKATQVAGGKGGGGSSLDGKRSRDPGVCACAEVPVSGATCAAALRAHVRAHTADL